MVTMVIHITYTPMKLLDVPALANLTMLLKKNMPKRLLQFQHTKSKEI